MTPFIAWIVLPLVLAVLSLGCGLLLEVASGMRLPGALLLPGGFIVVSLAAYFPHMFDLTARLETPLVVVLAVGGYALSRPWKRFAFDGWLTGAAVGVYGVFLAPVIFSGQATFTGYIRLDDTATYMALLDRAAGHAYNTHGLASSTYKAVLHYGYVFGYPLGSLLPLDVGKTIVRVDPLWLWQPYLTFLAVMIALGLYQLASGLVQSRALRACVAFFGAQAALMYGYALWGGVKELFVPGVVLFAACLVPRLREAGSPRQVLPLAAATAALISGESVGGGIWILVFAGVGLLLLILSRPIIDVLQRVFVYVVASALLAIPILSVSARRLHHIGKFTSGGSNGSGNLPHRPFWWQLFGIWPGGDFRFRPTHQSLTHLLCLLVALCVIVGAVVAWRRGRWEVLVALGSALFASVVYVGIASPWVAGKALASSSPLVLGVGLAGVAVLVESDRRITRDIALAAIAVVPLALIAGAVLWSSAMQYHAVLLAPSSRLMELEKIGHTYSGQGPALLTEFEPYAARYLLRGLNAEAPSELRVHPVCLHGTGKCRQATFGVSPDVDEIRLDQVLYYRTLIIRRTGSSSRPPSVYDRVWQGRYYDVWQRNEGPPSKKIISHLSLGSRFQPAGFPDCTKVMALAQSASDAHGMLATVFRPHVIVIQPDNPEAGAPTQFGNYGEPFSEYTATNAYARVFNFTAPTSGKYELWIGGSFSNTVTARIDGKKVGEQENQTEWPGNSLYFGSIILTRGEHKLFIKHSGPDLSPGSAAQQPFGLGPWVIAPPNEHGGITEVPPSKAHSLCGKSLDWVEALRG